jgi:hypothetical protein
MRIVLALCGLAMAVMACLSDGRSRPNEDRESGSCVIGGCAGVICGAEGQQFPNICIWLEEFACYRDATCDRQRDGTCGWTETRELTSCLAAHAP